MATTGNPELAAILDQLRPIKADLENLKKQVEQDVRAADSRSDPFSAMFTRMYGPLMAAAQRRVGITATPIREASSFEEKLSETAMWAAIRANRAREYSFEWLALGFALAGAHLLFVVAPKAKFTLLDLLVLILTAGGGIVMWHFETRRGSDLRKLSERLQEEASCLSQ